MKAPLERDTLKACLQLLTLKGVLHWRQNSGAFTGTYKGRKRFFRTASLLGVSDILGCLPAHCKRPGTLLSVEVKRPGQRPSPAQDAFLAAVGRSGGTAAVITDVAQLARLLDDLGV